MLKMFLINGAMLCAFAVNAESAQTSGACSPIVMKVHGDVQISCIVIANDVPVYVFKGVLGAKNQGTFARFMNRQILALPSN
jgi:hypothetical protein